MKKDIQRVSEIQGYYSFDQMYNKLTEKLIKDCDYYDAAIEGGQVDQNQDTDTSSVKEMKDINPQLITRNLFYLN